MGKNVLVLPCLLTFIALFCTLDPASLKDSCPRPLKLKSNYDYNWSSTRGESNNTAAKVSFLQLVFSWTPTFCDSLSESARKKEFQCQNSQHFGLVVHGLWPQASNASKVDDHPRNCRNEKQLDAAFVKRYFCLMPDEDLMQREWEKHGTCYYETAVDYFTTIETLYNSLTIPNIQSLESISRAAVKKAFRSSNPTLPSSAIDVSMKAGNRLKEISICYNLNHEFISCYS